MKLNYLIKNLQQSMSISILLSRIEKLGHFKLPKKKFIVLLFSCCFILFNNQLDAQEPLPGANGQTEIRGTVKDGPTGLPLHGATVKIGTLITKTDKSGNFSLTREPRFSKLLVTHIGFRDTIINLSQEQTSLEIVLKSLDNQIEEIEVVSTGYQQVARNRTTGSFSVVDQSQLSRNTGANILDRLDGAVPGLQFLGNGANERYLPNNIEIRGRSTISSDPSPLIILDDFPFEGEISSINPNDIQSVNVLKDAAAAAIWGSRAGNGVIVIRTKQGGSKSHITFGSNLRIGEKPNLYSANTPRLSAEEYIEAERFLFEQNAYDSKITNGYEGLSPVVEILRAQRDGNLSTGEADRMIGQLKSLDVRNDLLDFYYDNPVLSQTSAGISGSSGDYRYYLGLGRDWETGETVNSLRSRNTLNSQQSFDLFNERLNLAVGLFYSHDSQRSGETVSPSYPYDQFTDENGNPMAWTNANGLSHSYTDSVGNGKLLDWKYRPLQEIRLGHNRSRLSQDLRISPSLSYRLLPSLEFRASFAYTINHSVSENKNDLQRFYTRNMINKFSMIDGDLVIQNLPQGEIWDMGTDRADAYNGRFQVNFDQQFSWGRLNLLAGGELSAKERIGSKDLRYGVDGNTLIDQNASIDFLERYPFLYNNATGTIPYGAGTVGFKERFVSYFLNGTYEWKDRYAVSASARRDASNLFGVDVNEKGVPLWSVGARWELAKESFMDWTRLNGLRLRMTYGHTGNVNRSTSRYLTAKGGSGLLNYYDQPYANIVNPPNPRLRWERVTLFNLGLESEFLDNRISILAEYWTKTGKDLISDLDLAPQTGLKKFIGNAAGTSTVGVDLSLLTRNIQRELAFWHTEFQFSHSRTKVDRVFLEAGSNFQLISMPRTNLIEGNPFWGIYSFPYRGLDDQGAPIGQLQGEASQKFGEITSNRDRTDVILHGSSVPTSFGTLRNTVGFRNVSLSLNLQYALGYYFRAKALDNVAVYGYGGTVDLNQRDYSKRWKNPGDEAKTRVPALVYPADYSRNNLYVYSSDMVERADYISIRDLQFSWTGKAIKGFSPSITFWVSNVGILWSANDLGIDPRSLASYPLQRTYTLGINLKY